MSPDQVMELRRRITRAYQPIEQSYPARRWNAALDWIESHINDVINDPAFGSADGPVTKEEFEKVVRG